MLTEDSSRASDLYHQSVVLSNCNVGTLTPAVTVRIERHDPPSNR